MQVTIKLGDSTNSLEITVSATELEVVTSDYAGTYDSPAQSARFSVSESSWYEPSETEQEYVRAFIRFCHDVAHKIPLPDTT